MKEYAQEKEIKGSQYRGEGHFKSGPDEAAGGVLRGRRMLPGMSCRPAQLSSASSTLAGKPARHDSDRLHCHYPCVRVGVGVDR